MGILGRTRIGVRPPYCRWFAVRTGRAAPCFLSKINDVCSGSFSTKLGCPRHVRFTPDSDRTADIAGGSVRASNRPPICLPSASHFPRRQI